jgi:hypothetical protein
MTKKDKLADMRRRVNEAMRKDTGPYGLILPPEVYRALEEAGDIRDGYYAQVPVSPRRN